MFDILSTMIVVQDSYELFISNWYGLMPQPLEKIAISLSRLISIAVAYLNPDGNLMILTRIMAYSII